MNLYEIEEKEYLKKYSNFSFIKKVHLFYNKYEKEKRNEFFLDSHNSDKINDINENNVFEFNEEVNIMEKSKNNLNNINSFDLNFSAIKNLDESLFSLENEIPLFNINEKDKFHDFYELIIDFNLIHSFWTLDTSKFRKSINIKIKYCKISKNLNKSYFRKINHHFKRCDKFLNQLRAFKYKNMCKKNGKAIVKNKKYIFKNNFRYKYRISFKLKKYKK